MSNLVRLTDNAKFNSIYFRRKFSCFKIPIHYNYRNRDSIYENRNITRKIVCTLSFRKGGMNAALKLLKKEEISLQKEFHVVNLVLSIVMPAIIRNQLAIISVI